MAKTHVSFEGHKNVDFEAEKKVKVPVRVEFDANKK